MEIRHAQIPEFSGFRRVINEDGITRKRLERHRCCQPAAWCPCWRGRRDRVRPLVDHSLQNGNRRGSRWHLSAALWSVANRYIWRSRCTCRIQCEVIRNLVCRFSDHYIVTTSSLSIAIQEEHACAETQADNTARRCSLAPCLMHSFPPKPLLPPRIRRSRSQLPPQMPIFSC